MIRTALLVVGLMPLAACKEEPVKVEPPQTVTVAKPERQRIPGWALQELPEEAPRELSTSEAVALACRRLNVIRYANCIIGQLQRYDKGSDAEPRCKLNINQGCNP